MRQNKDGVQKLFRLFGHFSLGVLLLSTSLLCSSFAEFKKSQAASFSEYADERDTKFKRFLQEQWTEYNAQKGMPLYEKQKPKNIVSTQPTTIKSVGPKIHIFIKKIPLVEEVKPQKEIIPEIVKVDEKPREEIVLEIIEVDIKPKLDKTVTILEIKKDINFNFYGSNIGFNIDAPIKNANFYPRNQKGIENFFDTLASSDYDYLISDIEKISKNLNLNDWGVYLLVNEVSAKVFSNRDNVNLFSWFIFNKLGYAVKIGLANKHIVMMHYSKKIIYSTPNYTFGDKKYYVVSNYSKGGVGSLYSYKHDYPNATKDLDLSLKTLPNFENDKQSKTLSFKQFGEKYGVTYSYNKNLIDFMATYPQADYETYFNSPLEEETYEDIANGLKKYIDGKQASSAINFVLNFVQNAFVYEVDNQQFGREKVMFAEETLYFAKSDCEDRAILFAYLVKKLFKIGVIGVKYKDHMATALYIPMPGDSVKAGGRKFVIADPTYVNSNIGQSMPKYKSQIPDSYIVVKN